MASSVQPLTDKITDHQYQLLYDNYFTPQVTSSPIKFLEIGLGCKQHNVGASSQICEELSVEKLTARSVHALHFGAAVCADITWVSTQAVYAAE